MLPRRAQARFQNAALLAAVAVLWAPLFGLVHQATVRHVACAEHGEWVEAAPLTAAEAAAPEHHHQRTVAENGTPSREGESDLHCALADWSHARGTATTGDASFTLPVLARAEHALAPESDRRPPAIALLHLAPKLSPPLA